jgi:MFS transporter, OFA family, oxalate/formate antiporter
MSTSTTPENKQGWLVLLGLFVCYTVSNGVIFNSLPIFYPQLIENFGWDQAQVTKPAQMLFLGVAILSPFIGYLLDRYSPRLIMVLGTVVASLGLLWYSRMNSLSSMTLAYCLLALGLVMAGILPSMYIITQWFSRNRGLAVGIFLVGSSFGGAIFNPISAALLASLGWRSAILVLAALVVLILMACIFLLVRDRPAAGTADPKIPSPLNDHAEVLDAIDFTPSQADAAQNVSLGQALASPTFYLLTAVTGAMWFCIVGVIQHQSLHFVDLGGSLTQAAGILSAFFVASILGKVIFGYLGDRFSKKQIMMIATINMALGALMLMQVKAVPSMQAWLYAIIFGIGFSGTFTMIQLLIAEFYSGASYGRILGIVTMVDTLAGVMGIMTLGKMRAASGSYASAIQLLLIICLVAVACVPLLRKPRLS